MVRKIIGSVLIAVGLFCMAPGVAMLYKGCTADIPSGGSRLENFQAESARRNAQIDRVAGIMTLAVFSLPFLAGVWLIRRSCKVSPPPHHDKLPATSQDDIAATDQVGNPQKKLHNV